MTDTYDDIITLPHHRSTSRAHMSNYDRAAQFSPFAALTGYDDAVKETARLTDSKVELDEYELQSLNEKLNRIQDALNEEPEVSITYFVADNKKSGGSYKSISGIVKRIDEFEHLVLMRNGMKIPIEDIFEIDGDMFKPLEITE
ncbi:YolD-like family protein [Eubacterium limosum]|uniref:YolD-like family protein n=1 Tax=Eubacterium limosum TaxID=1736 RepID=UPI001D08B1F2|nr:YolD-like family protein [Eubacterium limosum]MCB6570575.1 YolD-like family protein [Eubacterium limosum]